MIIWLGCLLLACAIAMSAKMAFMLINMLCVFICLLASQLCDELSQRDGAGRWVPGVLDV